MNWNSEVEDYCKDTMMTSESFSKFCLALDKNLFDLDFKSSFQVEMADPSVTINSTLSIEYTLLTVKSFKKPFFWMNTEMGFTGVLVNECHQGQIDWMKDKMSEALVDIDKLLRDCYFYYGTQIGVIKEQVFIPYILLM
jgi:hypothetical protein